jgi:hypothetical protein
MRWGGWTLCGLLAQLDAGGYPPAVNLRPACDWPDTAHCERDLSTVADRSPLTPTSSRPARLAWIERAIGSVRATPLLLVARLAKS